MTLAIEAALHSHDHCTAHGKSDVVTVRDALCSSKMLSCDQRAACNSPNSPELGNQCGGEALELSSHGSPALFYKTANAPDERKAEPHLEQPGGAGQRTPHIGGLQQAQRISNGLQACAGKLQVALPPTGLCSCHRTLQLPVGHTSPKHQQQG